MKIRTINKRLAHGSAFTKRVLTLKECERCIELLTRFILEDKARGKRTPYLFYLLHHYKQLRKYKKNDPRNKK